MTMESLLFRKTTTSATYYDLYYYNELATIATNVCKQDLS